MGTDLEEIFSPSGIAGTSLGELNSNPIIHGADRSKSLPAICGLWAGDMLLSRGLKW
jgi:hypothetical protein